MLYDAPGYVQIGHFRLASPLIAGPNEWIRYEWTPSARSQNKNLEQIWQTIHDVSQGTLTTTYDQLLYHGGWGSAAYDMDRLKPPIAHFPRLDENPSDLEDQVHMLFPAMKADDERGKQAMLRVYVRQGQELEGEYIWNSIKHVDSIELSDSTVYTVRQFPGQPPSTVSYVSPSSFRQGFLSAANTHGDLMHVSNDPQQAFSTYKSLTQKHHAAQIKSGKMDAPAWKKRLPSLVLRHFA